MASWEKVFLFETKKWLRINKTKTRTRTKTFCLHNQSRGVVCRSRMGGKERHTIFRQDTVQYLGGEGLNGCRKKKSSLSSRNHPAIFRGERPNSANISHQIAIGQHTGRTRDLFLVRSKAEKRLLAGKLLQISNVIHMHSRDSAPTRRFYLFSVGFCMLCPLHSTTYLSSILQPPPQGESSLRKVMPFHPTHELQ